MLSVVVCFDAEFNKNGNLFRYKVDTLMCGLVVINDCFDTYASIS